MPAALHHGQWLEPTLSLISSRHVEYKETVRLWVDRSQAKPRPERKYNLRGQPVGSVGSPVAVSTPPGVTHDSGIGRATSVPGVSVAAERIVEGTS